MLHSQAPSEPEEFHSRMKLKSPEHLPPSDVNARRSIAPVICYPVDRLQQPDLAAYRASRDSWTKTSELIIPPREARCFEIRAGQFFRIVSVDAPQVGDLNLWNLHNHSERFYSGKTRALHGTHLSTGDRMWSNLPHLRPMATITEDTLDWYGFDAFGGAVHDVIGTRCDPYTHRLLSGGDYHHCCHSNLTRAFAAHTDRTQAEAEPFIHDVLNVFMCTGFTRDTGQYFMKATPARPGDFIEFFAEIDLLGALSACPGGDCGNQHSSELAHCAPLHVEVYCPRQKPVGWVPPEPNGYTAIADSSPRRGD